MKKFFTQFLCIAMIAIVASCGNSEEKKVLEFGMNFGEMVVNNDKQGIARVYPDLGTYTSAHLSYHRDQVDIFPEEDGKYKVRYGDGSYIIVKPGLNGAMDVVDSKGIFETGDEAQAVEVEQPKAKEKPAEKPEPKVKESKPLINNSPYPIAPGSHTFSGKAEGKYPIVVYLTVSSNGSVSGKMAYKSTLKKYGNSADHYMYMNGSFSGNTLYLTVDGGEEEWTVKASDNGSKYKLSGSAYNYKHMKSFSINVSGN